MSASDKNNRNSIRRIVLIVLDGVGVGALPDAAEFGDAGSNTIAHIADVVGGMDLPNLERLGLGRLTAARGLSADSAVIGAYGKCTELSRAKDSTTGHWELMGVVSERPFPTYPKGFPSACITELERRTGRGTLWNRRASGTEIIARLGDEHVRTGKIIVYTSVDSVFQIAAHEDVVPVEELYAICRAAREVMQGEHAVARIIARPFVGESGAYRRTPRRHDFSLAPPETVLDRLLAAGVPVVGVGKIDDLYGHQGISKVVPSVSNTDGMEKTLSELKSAAFGLVYTNLVDFDMTWGHRNDPKGFYGGLRDFDAFLPRLVGALEPEDLLMISADHGVDPTTEHTDHTREYVPILVAGPRVTPDTDLGVRRSYADVGATVAEVFGVAPGGHGTSFLQEILST